MSIKQKIWDKLDKDGYITDSDLAKIYGKEPNWITAEEYKRRWLRFKLDKERFENDKIIESAHQCKGYYIRLIGMDRFSWYRIGKDFYNSLIKKNGREEILLTPRGSAREDDTGFANNVFTAKGSKIRNAQSNRY